MLAVGNVLWAVGGLGTLVFGIWLAIYVKGYDSGRLDHRRDRAVGDRDRAGAARAGRLHAGAGRRRGGAAGARAAALMHWLRSLVVLRCSW